MRWWLDGWWLSFRHYWSWNVVINRRTSRCQLRLYGGLGLLNKRFSIFCCCYSNAHKFHIDAELVLRSTVRKLERGRRHAAESLFARHRCVVVSIDYIKADRRVDDFVNNCPNLVIVDEAHAATLADASGRGRQQRHSLVKRLAKREGSHLVLVTATPHSGNEAAFQSLVGLLDGAFANLPEDLEAKGREAIRRRLARHLVQRKRDDLRNYLGATEFPTALESEETYALSEKYRALFKQV